MLAFTKAILIKLFPKVYMKNHEGVEYVHFPEQGYGLLLGEEVKIIRDITDEAGNMISYVKSTRTYTNDAKQYYTPFGKSRVEMPILTTFLGNNKLFSYNAEPGYIADGKTFKIMDCATLEVLFKSPKVVNVSVDEEIIKYDGKILDSSTMTFLDANPRNNYTIEFNEGDIEITRYQNELIELPYFGHDYSKRKSMFIHDNYIIILGCRMWEYEGENKKCTNYKVVKIFSELFPTCSVWRIEAIKKPKAALRTNED